MDVKYINPFVSSTVQAFKTMMQADATPGKPMLKANSTLRSDVSGIIGLSGDARGSIGICFPKIAALKTVSAMIGTSIKVVGEEVTDGVGELANIIAGHAKQYLSEYNITISLPQVILGANHIVASLKREPAIVVPFTCPYGDFSLDVSLKTNE